ncbi:MAG: energy-coupling factor ABC transporter ATP-binding protein [Candidatus Hydrothermarchaeota archaeon]
MPRKMVEIKDLSYIYPDGTEALRGINLEIFEGESVGLIGPNGAGKSTLILHLNGILRSNNGEVRVMDMDMEKDIKEIRSKIGLVFQDPDDQLFSPSVFDDVAFGPINMGFSKKEVEKRVNMALSQVNMLGYEERSPHHLSYGEKKRIAIATVLSMNPEILVLDEPTSNIDPRSRKGLIKLLRSFNITKIIASHDMDLVAEVCDKAVLLYNGKIVANGPVEEILTDIDLLESHGLEPPTMVKLFKTINHKNVPLRLEDGIERLKKIMG